MSAPEEKIKIWLDEAEREWDIAKYLFNGRRYSACLFYCHLTIEKISKGLIIQRTRTIPPYSHDLVELVKYANITLNKTQKTELEKISDFNITGRYTEEKQKLYQKTTRSYTEKYL